MPTRTIYISDTDLATWVDADQAAQELGLSLSSVVVAQLAAWLNNRDPNQVQLYTTPALPAHYVAAKPDGTYWLLPCAPMSPDVWANAKPYRGKYALTRVVPREIEKYYQLP